MFAWAQPEVGLQESLVQALPSSHFSGLPPQDPPEHVSLVVQALPSLQATELLVCVQPLVGVQPSVVQTLPSSQFCGLPPQDPPEHASLIVQALLSLHEFVLFAWTQPVAGLQLSFVHPLPSLQFGGAPPTHDPPEHASPVVQALPSLHAFVLFLWTQPVIVLQESVVQEFPSLQFTAVPLQTPPEQVSLVVQALLSLHAFILFLWTQPVAGTHESLVQALLSLQFRDEPSALKHLFRFVIVQTILVAFEPMDSDFEVQFVQLPTGVGVRLQVPAPCAAHVALTKQLIELFPVHRPATSTQEMSVL